MCEPSQPWFGGDVLLQASAGNRREQSLPAQAEAVPWLMGLVSSGRGPDMEEDKGDED